jgi:hypothetical protein
VPGVLGEFLGEDVSFNSCSGIQFFCVLLSIRDHRWSDRSHVVAT